MAATEASDVSDGPVLNLVNKRIRALRKKFNRIIQMEEAIAQGKPINKEQEEVLRSKPAVSALIDELEKLRQPISVAVSEELDLAVQRLQVSLPIESLSGETTEKEDQGQGQENPTGSEPTTQEPEHNQNMVEDLLHILYFGSLFDVKSQSDFTSTMLTRTHERGCCLTYDYVTDDAIDLLGERDLDLISKLGGLLISRPVDSSLSHKKALQRCVEHARLWLADSDQPIELNSGITYSALRARLNKIMASDYFITTPEMKGPVEVAAAAVNYAPFQMPVAVQVEDSESQFQQKEDGIGNFQGHGIVDNQTNSLEDLQKGDELETEDPGDEDMLVPQEQARTDVEVEQRYRDFETKEQQYLPRRSYSNQRGVRGGGGGRRGYSNGRGSRGSSRGGGMYQNGGRNQYYDQPGPGGYHPRNYYGNRGRGGRGGGPSYNSNGYAAQVGEVSDGVGVGVGS